MPHSALCLKGTSRAGIFAGLITGTLTVFLWENIPVLQNVFYILVPALFLSLLVTVLLSKFTRTPDDAAAVFKAMSRNK
jgi:sodium/proline symporter